LGSGHDIYLDDRYLLIAGWGDWSGVDAFEQSPIYAFALTDDTLDYRGVATVTGMVPSQWALQVSDDVLYVASEVWRNGNHALLTSFALGHGALDKLDQTEPIAPGETLRSVRFLGDKAYLVTFRQMDPLFVIDLADPRHLAVLGELRIPGFSTYIHPLGDDRLLTVGFSGNEGGLDGGISVQTFAVGDPLHPTQIASYIIGDQAGSYASSPAQYDHHAFSFSPELGLLTLPYSLTTYGNNRDTNVSGLAFIRVGADGSLDGVAQTVIDRSENVYSNDICGIDSCGSAVVSAALEPLERTMFDYAHNEVLGFAPTEIIRFDAGNGELLRRYRLP